MKKVPLCNAKRLSGPGDEPVTCDDEGPKVCQNPVRGDRWLTVNTMFLFLGKEKWIGYCERVFFLCQKGWKVSKCFLLRMRKPRITLFFASQSQKEEIEAKKRKGRLKGVHPNKN